MDSLALSKESSGFEEIKCYTPKKGKWHECAGENPDDSIAQDQDFFIDYDGVVDIFVQQGNNDYGSVDRLFVTYKTLSREGLPEHFKVMMKINPNMLRDKTGTPILDELGAPIYRITCYAQSFVNGLIAHNIYGQGLRDSKGRLKIKKGNQTGWIRTGRRDEITDIPKELFCDDLGREATEHGCLPLQDAIASLQASNGFLVRPYPLPIQEMTALEAIRNEESRVLQPA